MEPKRVKEGNDLFRPRCARPPSPEGEGKGAGREKRLTEGRAEPGAHRLRPGETRAPANAEGAGREKRLIAPRTTLPDMAAETWRDELAPAWHFAEEIARVDRQIAEEEAIEPDPSKNRFLRHLRGTREVLAHYYDQQKMKEGASNDRGSEGNSADACGL
jgi:hypothetical protein